MWASLAHGVACWEAAHGRSIDPGERSSMQPHILAPSADRTCCSTASIQPLGRPRTPLYSQLAGGAAERQTGCVTLFWHWSALHSLSVFACLALFSWQMIEAEHGRSSQHGKLPPLLAEGRGGLGGTSQQAALPLVCWPCRSSLMGT